MKESIIKTKMEMIRKIFTKYSELIRYAFFGVLTTLVNFISFHILSLVFSSDKAYLVNNAVAWFVSVVFAYITNKLFVFDSKDWSASVILKEVPEFFGGRVFSFLIEELGLWLFVDLLHFSDYTLDLYVLSLSGELFAKAILAVIVVILNYFFSKLLVFRKPK